MKAILVIIIAVLCCFCRPDETVTFGVISDVHQDVMHDASVRIEAFIDEMNTCQADFIIQLGDFCRPYDYNRDFLSVWHSFDGPAYHVIGNHEMDGGFTRDSVVSFLDMPARYYSFDQNDFHFIVLDGNDKNPDPNRAPGYARFIGDQQITWLKKDLKGTDLQCIVFSHQSLRGQGSVENATQIRAVLEETNELSKKQKVLACFNGHNHRDTVITINNIHYIEVNSSSYDWVGGNFAHESYSQDIHKNHPSIQYTSPYAEGIWALVSISSKGRISIKGKETQWVGPSPQELGRHDSADEIRASSRIRDTLLFF